MKALALSMTVGLIVTSLSIQQHQGIRIISGVEAASISEVPQGDGDNGGSASTFIVTPDYVIGPEDVLEISVWRNQDLSKQVAVRPDGRISLPLIGDVMAGGKTPAELTRDISTKLKEYKENPTVAILVQQVNSYAVYLLGEVGSPGKYPLKSKMTLLQGITVAGGLSQNAARNKIVLFRFGKNGQEPERLRISYDDIVLRDGSEQNIELKPGDTIVVPSETMVVIP